MLVGRKLETTQLTELAVRRSLYCLQLGWSCSSRVSAHSVPGSHRKAISSLRKEGLTQSTLQRWQRLQNENQRRGFATRTGELSHAFRRLAVLAGETQSLQALPRCRDSKQFFATSN